MNSEVLLFLNKLISENDRIILYDSFPMELLGDVINRITDNPKFVLLMNSKTYDMGNNQVKYVSKEYIDEINRISRLYEFSDKISIISLESLYGEMYNYYKTGIISKEDMVDSLI